MPKSLDQPAAFSAEDKNVTLERITTKTFLQDQSKTLIPLRISQWPLAIQTRTLELIGII